MTSHVIVVIVINSTGFHFSLSPIRVIESCIVASVLASCQSKPMATSRHLLHSPGFLIGALRISPAIISKSLLIIKITLKRNA